MSSCLAYLFCARESPKDKPAQELIKAIPVAYKESRIFPCDFLAFSLFNVRIIAI
jgi:hypothetical protein